MIRSEYKPLMILRAVELDFSQIKRAHGPHDLEEPVKYDCGLHAMMLSTLQTDKSCLHWVCLMWNQEMPMCINQKKSSSSATRTLSLGVRSFLHMVLLTIIELLGGGHHVTMNWWTNFVRIRPDIIGHHGPNIGWDDGPNHSRTLRETSTSNLLGAIGCQNHFQCGSPRFGKISSCLPVERWLECLWLKQTCWVLTWPPCSSARWCPPSYKLVYNPH